MCFSSFGCALTLEVQREMLFESWGSPFGWSMAQWLVPTWKEGSSRCRPSDESTAEEAAAAVYCHVHATGFRDCWAAGTSRAELLSCRDLEAACVVRLG